MAEYIVPIITALIAGGAAAVSVVYGRRAAHADRMADAEDLATRYREPLLQAVFNLETRIYNVLELDFLGRFLGQGSTEEERDYAVLNTLYVFAQYFCWVEIVRRGSLFVDPRSIERNRLVAHRLEEVRDRFSDSRTITDRAFRVFRGEQRALGELLLVPSGGEDGAPRWECMGYAAFVESMRSEVVEKWFRCLRSDIVHSAGTGQLPRARLCAVHEGLMDIVDALDPELVRFPLALRHRSTGAPGAEMAGLEQAALSPVGSEP